MKHWPDPLGTPPSAFPLTLIYKLEGGDLCFGFRLSKEKCQP